MKKILAIVNKIRAMGPKVLCQYALRNVRLKAKLNRLMCTVKEMPLQPVSGITIVGQLTDNGSVNKTLRDFIIALKNAGIPYQTVDFGYKHNAHPADYEELLTPEDEINLTRYTHLVEMGHSIIPDGIVQHRATVLFWEYDSGIKEAFPNAADGFDIVVAMCDFNYQYYKKVYPDKDVKKILYPFMFLKNVSFDCAALRRQYRYAPDDFIVFFNYNFKTGFNRKNPQGAIRAFASAFKDTPNAKLLFKTQNAKMFPSAVRELRALAESCGVGDRLHILDCYIPMRDIYGLTAACDVYLSLHRGEGFGIGMAEAMSLGVPVVATDYSASTEFVKENCAIPIPYKLEPVKDLGCDPAYYYGVKQWPEPDFESAGRALKKLYDDPAYKESLGRMGKAFLEDHFSIANFRKSILEFLQE